MLLISWNLGAEVAFDLYGCEIVVDSLYSGGNVGVERVIILGFWDVERGMILGFLDVERLVILGLGDVE